MTDKELAEVEIIRLIDVLYKQGFNYWTILGMFMKTCLELYLQAEVEYQVKRERG